MLFRSFIEAIAISPYNRAELDYRRQPATTA
jgi:hypothetical protein